MPQFDKINFFSQIFWIIFFILITFFIILKIYLPLYSKILKTRIKILFLEKQLSNLSIKIQKLNLFLLNLLVFYIIYQLWFNLFKNYNLNFFWLKLYNVDQI